MNEIVDKIERVRAVAVQPGDIVVVTLKAACDEDDRHHITRTLQNLFPGNNVIVLNQAELSVYQPRVEQ